MTASVVTPEGGVGFVMPSPGADNGLKWLADGSTTSAVIPSTASSYLIDWAYSVVGSGTFECRVNDSAVDWSSGSFDQKTVAYPLQPGDVVTVWCTSGSDGSNMFLNYVRIRVRG
jgi:hypothetical protein